MGGKSLIHPSPSPSDSVNHWTSGLLLLVGLEHVGSLAEVACTELGVSVLAGIVYIYIDIHHITARKCRRKAVGYSEHLPQIPGLKSRPLPPTAMGTRRNFVAVCVYVLHFSSFRICNI